MTKNTSTPAAPIQNGSPSHWKAWNTTTESTARPRSAWIETKVGWRGASVRARSLGNNNGLADHLAVGERVEGGAPVGERIFLVDARLQPALLGQLPDRGAVLAAALGELASVLAGPYAHHREALDQRHVDRDGRDAAGCEPHDQQAPVEGDAAHALVEHVAAHRVIDHVRAAS